MPYLSVLSQPKCWPIKQQSLKRRNTAHNGLHSPYPLLLPLLRPAKPNTPRLQLEPLQQSVKPSGKVNTDRATPPVKKETPEDHPPPQEFTKFGIRVAHARYIPRADPQSASPPQLLSGLSIQINGGVLSTTKTPVTFDGLKERLQRPWPNPIY
jgi:hypothetical protein